MMADYGSSSRDYMEDQSHSIEHLLINEQSITPVPKAKWSLVLTSAGGMILISTVILLLTTAKTMYGPSSMTSQLSKKTTIKAFGIAATNEYGQYDGKNYPWMSDVDGTQLVEPYKNTTLTMTGTYATNQYTYVWSISSQTDEDVEDAYAADFVNSTSQEVVFTKVGIYSVHVYLYNSTGIAYSYATRLVCKYVKRELRSLTTADKEKFLDAAVAIWNYRDAEGKELYGEKFTSVDTLVAVHSMASNDIMCDGFHEGTGFISHHLALTNTFEAALRAVDPSVTLPYWDFTIEGEAVKLAGKPPSYMLEVSPVFDDDWFGSTDNITNRVITSRWAGAKMPKNLVGDAGVQNSYGYIRSYWNNNGDDEISRRLFDTCGVEAVHKSVPSCSEHYDVLNSLNLGKFQSLSPADGHGPMHVQIGGMWGGCVQAYKDFEAKWGDLMDTDMTDEEILAIGYAKWKWGNTAPRRLMVETAVIGEYFHIYRSFWRSHMCAVDGKPNYLVCPDSCDSSIPFEECTCQVDALINGTTTWQNLFPCLLNSEANRNFFTAAMPDEMISDLVYMTATASVQEGEMIESASTADIMFWLTHPVIERMLSAKRLPDVTMMGSQEFYKWPVVNGMNETWLEYSYYTFEKGANPGFSSMNYRCAGHGADDVALPGNLTYTDAIKSIIDINGDGVESNWEFFLAMDPNNMYGNDYVWDHFNWDHCS